MHGFLFFIFHRARLVFWGVWEYHQFCFRRAGFLKILPLSPPVVYFIDEVSYFPPRPVRARSPLVSASSSSPANSVTTLDTVHPGTFQGSLVEIDSEIEKIGFGMCLECPRALEGTIAQILIILAAVVWFLCAETSGDWCFESGRLRMGWSTFSF